MRYAAAFAFTLVLLTGAPLRAQEPAHDAQGHAHTLGTVDFPNSGAPAAQEPFLRAIALLHSFEYTDAAEAFREAQAADPDFALAYWGEALTNTQLLWGVDDTTAARAALMRLAPTPKARLARAPTERERAYGAAVEAFFAEAETAVRARAFADSLKSLAARAPDDHEAAAFASIAIQMAAAAGTYGPEERNAAREEAVALADRVFHANPDHPGAAHYLIHGYDDPVLAPRGLEAARAYAEIAPDAEHALHMPSHIFVQVGQWADAARSNERAWAASRAWVAERGVAATELDFHSLEWLQYAYLQLGRHASAAALVDSAHVALAGADLAAVTYPDARYVVPRLEFALAANSGDWAAWPVAPPVEEGASPSVRARAFAMTAVYQRAAGAAKKGDPALAEAAAPRIRKELAGTPQSRWADFAAQQLEALAAEARGNHAVAIERLTRAAAAEAELPAVGPPAYLPTHELLGAALLAAHRPGEAADAFEAALARRPNRSPALLGLARARAALEDETEARNAYRKLMENWVDADPDLPALEEARRGAGRSPAEGAAQSW
jgi:tetratricopeptide (TPR) repeat protein